MNKTKQFLLTKFKLIPQIAIITGSGVELFYSYKPSFEMKYKELPAYKSRKSMGVREYGSKGVREYGSMGVQGHEGKLKFYKIKNKGVLVFSGRRHLYEGLDITNIVLNVRLAYELGIGKLIITNAAGGINKKLKAGDLMLITGFIDLMQSTERGVLSGISQPPFKIKTRLSNQLSALSFKLKKGIYAGMLGPTYETYSEIKFLQQLGASAVGMSTIPEIICAKSLGMDFAGISVISNTWDSKHKPSHEEVLKNVKKANGKLNDLILKII